jgi:phenylpropionate dioxygenase-like ring-hydroxylating dioxygenase large terminal subunit
MSIIASHNINQIIRDEPENGRFMLHKNAYADNEIFGLEMKKIFASKWLYLAHESQIPLPNDYLTMNVSDQPVILLRDQDGNLQCFYNRCMHRGASLSRNEKGNSSRFRCFYHGWTYKNTGELIGVADREGYDPNFDLSCLGLKKIAKIESYRGFIFGCLNPDVSSLEEHLGKAKFYLDLLLNKYPDGIQVAKGVTSYGYKGNWKLQCENALDFYHLPFVHKSFMEIKKARGQKSKLNFSGMADDYAIYLGNGHGTVISKVQDDKAHNGEFPYHQHLLIFPNLVILENPAPQIRVIHPKSVDYTDMKGYAFFSKMIDPGLKAQKLRAYEKFFGPAGFGTPDDIEAFHSCMDGYRVDAAPWNDLSRGMHRERVEIDVEGVGPFEVAGNITDDTIYRYLYRQWAETIFD